MFDKLSVWFYIKGHGIRSLFLRRFILVFSVILLSALIIIVGVSARALHIMKTESLESVGMKINGRAAAVDNFLKTMDRLAAMISIDSNVADMLSNESVQINITMRQNIRETLERYLMMYDYIDYIEIYSEKRRIVLSNVYYDDIKNLDSYSYIEAYEDGEENLEIIYDKIKNPDEAVILKRIKGKGGERVGAIFLKVGIRRAFSSVGIQIQKKDEIFFVSDADGKILLSSMIESIGDKVQKYRDDDEVVLGGKTYMSLSCASVNYNFDYTYLYDYTYYDFARSKLMQFILMMVLCMMCCGALVAMLFIFVTYRPIAELMSYISDNDGDDEGSLDEMGYIMNKIINLTSNNRLLAEENKKNLMRLNKAQIYAMQNQIKPHLIYNTLEAIKWLIMEPDTENKASQMIECLSRMLRYCLEMERYLVSVRAEIENAHMYSDILKMRYEKRINFVWSIPDDLLDCEMIKLSLQPIIENAFYHGIVPANRVGTITTRARHNGAYLEFEIEDDGVGMNEKTLENLRGSLNAEKHINGIGMYNVCYRIRLVYNISNCIEIFSEEGKGTRVVIKVPYRKTEMPEDTLK